MINEIVLELAALVLALFCLTESVRQRRDPLPKGPGAVIRDRRSVYTAALCALAVSAAASLAEKLGLSLGAPAGLPRFLHVLGGVFQAVLYLAFALYLADLPVLGHTRKGDRGTALLLAALMLIGAAVQALWSVPVMRFFEAVALFGCLVLLERDRADDGSGHFETSTSLVIALTLLAVIVMNAALILNLSNSQSEEIGNTQLDVIRSDLQKTISDAESDVLRVAMGAEQLLESGASRETLTEYFYGQREKHLSSGSFMNVYISGRDWIIVPEFDIPADFHPAERVWYIGAQDNPGEVYITEPYLDADTGNMCFSVSTLLSDGETVVGMDLNFSKTQESILRMTQGRDQTAMIVTSGGLIVGYTDMSLVGERADEKLPEYAAILRRVASSQEHGSFRVELDGRPCMIFSSETSNHWYLILSADLSTLYGDSYRQMAMMASVNLLMLAVVLVFRRLSSRRARQAETVVSETGKHLGGFSQRLRELAAHLQRVGDVRLIHEGDGPAEIAGRVGDSGKQLSLLADELSSYSDVLHIRAEQAHDRTAGKGAEAVGAPSRRARNEIILAMLISLVIVLVFCVRITTSWGTTRMNREADAYENQVNEWLAQQKSLLYMFTDVISSRPELIGDYDSAVLWLNDVARHYPEISGCYMANPYAEHPVIMNTGWEPGEDERPETRPWYRATERSADGFNISAPYLDAQTGAYCVTFSRVVYGQQGEFLGIFGIDFFLDKLILVLGGSYTSRSYAFLVDSEGIIINHPNGAYQMGEGVGTSVEDTEYAEACSREGVTAVRDYSGRLMACLSRRTGSGFMILVADRWWDIYGSVVLVAAVILVLFGACLCFVVSMINRLIRWQAEVNRQLVDAAEAATSANRAKSRFLSQMSHEIRTPMNAIIGLDNLVLRDESISPQTREGLEKIGTSAQHLLALINDILDMSRIESGRMVLRHERFSFRTFLEQITIIINGQCEEKGLRFVCSRTEPLDEYFVGDDLKLKQVLINILGNSVKFTDPPGVITFSIRQTNGPDDTAVLRFTMEDTGIGMDKAFIPKLFEAFSQEDDGSTTRYGGSGLGMAITKSIVEMMGGEIDVESEKGLGTTFTVSVRLGRVQDAQAEEVPAEEASVEDVSLEGRHILIAEDQAMNAEILTDLLELEDMSSEWAENGKLAVELFAGSGERHFDAILMDMRMPVMDGLDATREIRRLDRPDARTIPIVALTGNAFEEDVRLCLEAGMDAHLSKPVDIEKLKETLRRLLAARG